MRLRPTLSLTGLVPDACRLTPDNCRGPDAAGHQPLSKTQDDGPEVFTVSSMAASTKAVDGLDVGGFKVVAVDARPRNSYICNDTHYRALRALQQ